MAAWRVVLLALLIAGVNAASVDCGGTTVETDTNTAHCGACNNACTTGQVCVGGVCKDIVPFSLTVAGGSAVATALNAQSTAAKALVASALGVNVAEVSDLVVEAQANNMVAITAVATVTAAQKANSGTIVTKLRENAFLQPVVPASTTVTVGDPIVCASGETRCQLWCVNAQTNTSNCGACGTTCTGGKTCTTGSCSCAGSHNDCGGTCTTDACVTCTSPQTNCANSCVTLTSDTSNCGTCGTVCDTTTQTCVNGQCKGDAAISLQVPAAPGLEWVLLNQESAIKTVFVNALGSDGSTAATVQQLYVNPVSDSALEVTAISTVTTAHKTRAPTILAGLRQIPVIGSKFPENSPVTVTGLALCTTNLPDRCNRTCVKKDTDTSNCGACGTVCHTDGGCVSGACACHSGETDCGGLCQTDACATCTSPMMLCNGTCVDLTTTKDHCGACFTACSETCSSSVCKENTAFRFSVPGGTTVRFGLQSASSAMKSAIASSLGVGTVDTLDIQESGSNVVVTAFAQASEEQKSKAETVIASLRSNALIAPHIPETTTIEVLPAASAPTPAPATPSPTPSSVFPMAPFLAVTSFIVLCVSFFIHLP